MAHEPNIQPLLSGCRNSAPELAGRGELIETARIALERTRLRFPAKSLLLVGLRGVGKTVLLDHIREMAEGTGIHTLRIEAPEQRSLPAMLAPQLRQALLRLSNHQKARDLANRGLRALAGFAKSLKVKYKDIEVGLDFDPEPGLADNGDLEHDLQDLLDAAGSAAEAAETALALFIDELQYVEEEELASLITALHRAAQRRHPVVLVGAGLPQLRGRMGLAKSYAERLFDFPEIGPLPESAARQALVKPAASQNVQFDDVALTRMLIATQGYPYFLQEWGKHAWEAAATSPISPGDVDRASITAIAALDESFFRVRFDRLTPLEKRYLRAMAELGCSSHRSGDIAEVLGRSVNSFAPTRNKLISKGMIWSPNHGDTAFTVPLFDEFMKRVMPGGAWKSE